MTQDQPAAASAAAPEQRPAKPPEKKDEKKDDKKTSGLKLLTSMRAAVSLGTTACLCCAGLLRPVSGGDVEIQIARL